MEFVFHSDSTLNKPVPYTHTEDIFCSYHILLHFDKASALLCAFNFLEAFCWYVLWRKRWLCFCCCCWFGFLSEYLICWGVSSSCLCWLSMDTKARIFSCLTLGSHEYFSLFMKALPWQLGWWRCLISQINFNQPLMLEKTPAWYILEVTCLLVRLLNERGLLVVPLQPSP